MVLTFVQMCRDYEIEEVLMKGEVDLRVGNGAKVAALEQGDYELTLPFWTCYFIKKLSLCSCYE